MSKLSDAIRVKQGERVMPPKMHMLPLNINADFATTGRMMFRQYHIGVEIHAHLNLPDNPNAKSIQNVVEHCRRMICEEVFGEFRPMLLKIITSAYENDFEKVETTAEEILKRMFQR